MAQLFDEKPNQTALAGTPHACDDLYNWLANKRRYVPDVIISGIHNINLLLLFLLDILEMSHIAHRLSSVF